MITLYRKLGHVLCNGLLVDLYVLYIFMFICIYDIHGSYVSCRLMVITLDIVYIMYYDSNKPF